MIQSMYDISYMYNHQALKEKEKKYEHLYKSTQMFQVSVTQSSSLEPV